VSDADLDALLRDVANQPRRLTTTTAIVLAALTSLPLWVAAAWLAVTYG
jgi:hypothetical protein